MQFNQNFEMESFQKSLNRRSLAVVVPAHNEELTISDCIESISSTDLEIGVYVSNNCSADSTERIIKAITSCIKIRKVETLLSPVSHYVSSGRWALENSSAEYFCFLAADDLFSSNFVSRSIVKLSESPEYEMTFPSVEWFSDVDSHHRIKAPKLGYRFAKVRQIKAFLLPNTSEIANQVYGIFSRTAFENLINNFERNGERFGADYFAVIETLASHRSFAIREAFVYRRVRQGEDLLKRVNFKRSGSSSLPLTLWNYLKLHAIVNNSLAETWSASKGLPITFCRISTQLLRSLQIFIEIPVHIARRIN